MAPPPGPPRFSTHDTAIGWMILLTIFSLLFALCWFLYEYEIKSVFRWFRYFEIWIISLFVDENYTILWRGQVINYEQTANLIPNIPRKELDSAAMGLISAMAMIPLRIPATIVLCMAGIWCMMSGPGTQYRRKLGLDGLIGVQAKIFPVISPFVKFNPSKAPFRAPGSPVPAELPLFAEALGPEEWLAYHQIPIVNNAVDEQAAFIAFTKQLGPRWQGPMKLAPHKQILLAAFCLKASRKRKESDTLMGRLAKCWSHDKGLRLSHDPKLLGDARKILRSRDLAALTLQRCNQHGFETTAMLRALATAREEGGVLAPAQFLWLRGHDRTLWYPLNNLGRQAFHMEAMGAMAHFKAEKLTRRPIPKPKVHEAVRSISDYMVSGRARPIPPLEQKKKKK